MRNQMMWHGTRDRGLARARERGFALRDVEETARVIAETVGLPAERLIDTDDYDDALGSRKQVEGLVSLATVRNLAEAYARTGSGTVSDLLAGAYELLPQDQRPPTVDEFQRAWLDQHEGEPVVIEFSVPPSAIVTVADGEAGVPTELAPSYAVRVWRLEGGTSEPFQV